MSLPEKFGHYEVHSELGRGGMAIVYKCWEESLQRYVAIKVLTSHLAQEKDVKERFFREAKSMAAISHPNVINVHFIGEEQGQPFFAMEYIEGQSLSEILADHRVLDINHAKNLLHQACEGLLAAHDSGLIHRDIKPGNMIIAENGYLKLLDFGIAQSHQFDKNLTQTGEVVGTPGYLSPEICIGDIVDKRSDIYSLGIVFYQMLAGDVPFDTSTPYKLLKDIVESDIANIQEINNKVDNEASDILLKMIDKNPDNRFQDCQQVLDALGKVEKNVSIDVILQKSITNQLAEKTSRISYQLTQISHPTKIGNKKRKNLRAVSMLAILILSGFIIYFSNLNKAPVTPEMSVTEISETDSADTNLLVTDVDADLKEGVDNNQNTDTSDGIKKDIQPVTDIDELVFVPQSCLEVGLITVLNPEPKRSSNKEQYIPEEELLNNIRVHLIDGLSVNKLLLERFSEVKPECLTNEQSYRLSVLISEYKKGSKSKFISKIGLGKEKISIILSLRDLITNYPLASKEIDTKDISSQIESTDVTESEFLQSVELFLQEATDKKNQSV